MSVLKLDVTIFDRRAEKLFHDWESNPNSALRELDAFVITAGKIDGVYGKTLSLHTWLFGYELQDTIVLFCKKRIYILCGKKKLEFLQPLTNKTSRNFEVALVPRNPADNDKAGIEKLLDSIRKEGKGKLVGHLAKDKFSSDLTNAFQAALSHAGFELRDSSSSISDLLAVKEPSEINIIKKACEISCNLFNKHLKEQIMDIIDYDKKVKHEKLSTGCQSALQKVSGVDVDSLEMCYDPIIQSGGNYNLKFSTESDSNTLHFDTIVCSIGARYHSYCSNVIRTLMVNPTEVQLKKYTYLHDLLNWAIDNIKPGAKIGAFCQSIIDKVSSDRPDLSENLVRSFGFVTGIEFRDSLQVLSTKSTGIFRESMTLNFNIGLQNLLNAEGKSASERKYALWLGDVIGIGLKDDKSNDVYTLLAKRRPKSISLYIKEDDDEDEENQEEEDHGVNGNQAPKSRGGGQSKSSRAAATKVGNGLTNGDVGAGQVQEMLGKGHRRAAMGQNTRNEPTSEDKRVNRLKELFTALLKNSTNRLTGLKTDTGLDAKTKSTVAYKGAGQMPKEDDIRRLRLFVDKKYETVILPIFGLPTPFHISTIKNVSTSIEADYTYLRINFHHPGAVVGVKDTSNFQYPEATYVKEMTYRASNQRRLGESSIPSTNLNNAYRIIKEVLKRFRSREAEERERANLVEQDQLVVDHAKGAFRLKDLYIRPNFAAKRITGTLEAHANGFRFTSIRGDQVDILYNNIKHAFYQPCDGEMIILLHFHLKNAIMYGKKKHQDIQFYTEVGELTTDLSKAHSRMTDRDDLEAEHREREMRDQIKNAFRTFVDRTESLARRYNLEFETPFRDLGFYGCPHRSTVLLMPTSSSIVSVIEFPPFVVSLEKVEFVMLERVSLSIRTFDMVLVFKDYHKKPVMINSIPSTALELVKEWLISCDLYYAEGTKSLNWPKLMKTILDDPESFIEQGGWSFISMHEGGDSGEEGDSETDDENYVPSGSLASGDEGGDADDGDDDDEYSASGDDDEDEDWDAEEDSDEPESLDSDQSEGKDWDELEAEAKREDAMIDEDGDVGRNKKRPRPARSPSPDARKKARKDATHSSKPHFRRK